MAETKQPKPNIKPIAAADARTNFADILAEAYYQGQTFLIKKSRKPMAVVLGIEEFRQLQQAAQQGASSPTPVSTKKDTAVDKILSVSY